MIYTTRMMMYKCFKHLGYINTELQIMFNQVFKSPIHHHSGWWFTCIHDDAYWYLQFTTF